MTEPETIFALSSGAPPAAIAIVRISGPEAGAALATLAGSLPEPRRATLRALRAPNGAVLDHALLLWFPGPDSATGEDVAELHVHGGRAVVAAVLAALGTLRGCRAARPGEFTRRSFVNGRIDLAQAEALGDLLAAETERQRRQAIRGVEGALGRQVAIWRDRILHVAAEVEAELDFADEGDVALRVRDPRPALATLADEIAAHAQAPAAERLRDGLRVVIAGPPNSGKSSLLNVLAGRDAAIVSNIAGTTRDRIEVPLALDGIPFVLTDTAGLHESDDAIERAGIALAQEAIEGADILLWLGAPGDAPEIDGRRLILHARADEPGRGTAAAGSDLKVSILGEGLRELGTMLRDHAATLLPQENELAINARQRAALGTCEDRLREASSNGALECMADDLHRALLSLDEVRGGGSREAVLDALFSRFCLGK